MAWCAGTDEVLARWFSRKSGGKKHLALLLVGKDQWGERSTTHEKKREEVCKFWLSHSKERQTLPRKREGLSISGVKRICSTLKRVEGCFSSEEKVRIWGVRTALRLGSEFRRAVEQFSEAASTSVEKRAVGHLCSMLKKKQGVWPF